MYTAHQHTVLLYHRQDSTQRGRHTILSHEKMVADYFTKPLQGALFYKFRDQIMGVVEMETILGVDPINHRILLESDQSDTTNEGYGTEPKGDVRQTSQSRYQCRENNRVQGKPPIISKAAPPILPDPSKWTKVVKRGRRADGRSTSIPIWKLTSS